MLDYIKENIGTWVYIILMLLLFALCYYGAYIQTKQAEETWNDGYCRLCNCPWQYQDMYYVKNSGTVYVYVDKEGHSFKSHTNFGLGVDK
jgi:hypothetical protein